MALLELRRLTKSFGGLTAVDQVDVALDAGEILGLVGPNGAGKTTVFNLMTGFLRPTSGKIVWRDKDIARLKPHQIAAQGIARTFQATVLFHEQSLWENVIIACYLRQSTGILNALLGTPDYHAKERAAKQRALEALHFVGLGHLAEEKAKNLSFGHQRALGVAVALSAEPDLLLLDEPLAGMSQHEIEFMLGLIRKIRDGGVTIVLVEHNMKAVMSLCDRIVVLDFGRKIAEGVPDLIVRDEKVIEAYLGVKQGATSD